MQLPTASRHTRVRRLLAVSAAAVAVMIAPTACDYGGYGGGSSSDQNTDDMGNMPGMDHGSPQHQQVVPVANTRQSTSDDSNRRNRDRNRPTTSPAATTTTTAATTTTDPAVPVTDPTDTTAPVVTDPAAPVAGGVNTVGVGGKDGKNNGLAVLGRDCAAVVAADKGLQIHDGFQDAGATCVETQMGAVAAKDKLPSLLITEAPRVVGMNQAFTLKVSTRNLVRDRFLGAKAGGYYLESSFLDGSGLQRGHFHTACRILANTNEAPDSSADPKFFLATEDGGGGTTPDVVTIPVPAMGAPGIVQCSSWAGDGSHRTPMMTQANETPAFDSVRIFVTKRDQPVSFDGRGRVDSGRTDRAHAAQSGAQKPDANPAAPAAPNAAAAPATAVDDAGKPIADDAAPAAPSDGTAGTDPAPAAADAPATTTGG
jgi:hypothetical protein